MKRTVTPETRIALERERERESSNLKDKANTAVLKETVEFCGGEKSKNNKLENRIYDFENTLGIVVIYKMCILLCKYVHLQGNETLLYSDYIFSVFSFP